MGDNFKEDFCDAFYLFINFYFYQLFFFFSYRRVTFGKTNERRKPKLWFSNRIINRSYINQFVKGVLILPF